MDFDKYQDMTSLSELYNDVSVDGSSLTSLAMQPMTSTPEHSIVTTASFDDVSEVKDMKSLDYIFAAVLRNAVKDLQHLRSPIYGSRSKNLTQTSAALTPATPKRNEQISTPKSMRANLLRLVKSSPRRIRSLLNSGGRCFASPACLKDEGDVTAYEMRRRRRMKRCVGREKNDDVRRNLKELVTSHQNNNNKYDDET